MRRSIASFFAAFLFTSSALAGSREPVYPDQLIGAGPTYGQDASNASNLKSGVVSPSLLPSPTTTSPGVVYAAPVQPNQFLTGIDAAGRFIYGTNPAFDAGALATGTLAPARLPVATPTTPGGAYDGAAPIGQYQSGVANGKPLFTSFTYSASDLINGTLPSGRLPVATPATPGGAYDGAATAHQFQTGMAGGKPTFSIPAIPDVNGLPAALGKAGNPVLTPYLGIVSTRNIQPSGSLDPNKKDAQSITRHLAQENITTYPQVCYANYLGVAGQGEVGTGAVMQVLGSAIEYPIGSGVFRSQTFNGSLQGTIADKTIGCSDVGGSLGIVIPKGQWYAQHDHLYNPNGVPLPPAYSINTATSKWTYDRSKFASTQQTDLTLTNDPSIGNAAQAAFPVITAAPTMRPSVEIIGDSINLGIIDQPDDATGDQGETARSVGPNYGYVLAAISGDTIAPWIAGNNANRIKIMSYVSSVVTDYGGINDVSRGLAPVLADIMTLETGIKSAYPSIKLFENTRLPNASSTDNFTTIVNQTPMNVAYFAGINGYIRGGSLIADGYFDTQAAIAAPGDLTRWSVNANGSPNTLEGIHPTLLGNLQIRDSNVIYPAAFNRPGGSAPIASASLPTITTILAGSSSYTAAANPISGQMYTPPPGAKTLEIEECGGSGGGSGSGTAFVSAMAGAGGTSTTFGSLNALAGNGAASLYAGGSPGAATTSGFDFLMAGQPGSAGQIVTGAGPGGTGGNSGFIPGGGKGATGAAGSAGTANSGSGGSGGGYNSQSSPINTGAGGGGGACGKKRLTAPLASSYTFSVGTGGNGGAAGASGFAGANGASGYIRIGESY